MKYLELYKEWMEAGSMPKNGLCFLFRDDQNLKLFKPPSKFYYKLVRDGLAQTNFPRSIAIQTSFWGSGDNLARLYQFTPLRQNIVLLMAAMNGEL